MNEHVTVGRVSPYDAEVVGIPEPLGYSLFMYYSPCNVLLLDMCSYLLP